MEFELPSTKIEVQDRHRHKALKALIALYGFDETCKIANITELELIRIIKPEKSKRVMRLFEQTTCPNCRKIILAPDVVFAADDDREKKRTGNCIWCKVSITFLMRREGPIVAQREGDIVEFNQDTIRTGTFAIPGIFQDNNIGVELVGPIVGRHMNGEWEVRVPIAIMGKTNFESSSGANAFDQHFHDNYAMGRGKTEEEALKGLLEDVAATSRTLF